MMLRVPLTKLEKSWSTSVFFMSMLIMIEIGFGLFVIPMIADTWEIFIWITDGILFIIMMTSYLIATFRGKINELII
jgi:hypothetical protein